MLEALFSLGTVTVHLLISRDRYLVSKYPLSWKSNRKRAWMCTLLLWCGTILASTIDHLLHVWIIATSLHVASTRIHLLFIMAIINATWFKRVKRLRQPRLERRMFKLVLNLQDLTKRTRRITFEVIIIAVRIAMAGTKAKKTGVACFSLELLTTSTDSFTLYIH